MILLRAWLFYLMTTLSLISLVTGIFLYLWPHGPRSGRLLFLGFDRFTWSEWHTYASLLALIIVIIHIIFNRRLVKQYIKWTIESSHQ
ncbi:MAG: DUF4405 domain-containing protein [Nitrososphaerota archaeon]|nr:DUF4405 domain-containing protein [Nitrososphaerales archaeon]MDW8045551.1 DUF4405 domain-containing protein [Nitrososphaerota archaeon]